MKIKHITLTIICLGAWLTAMAGISDLTLTGSRISASDGLASNGVNLIYEDHHGFMWFGTNSGLSRYDGYSFQNFYSLTSDESERISSNIGRLIEDEANDLLWIQNATFNFSCYDMRRGRFVSYTGKGDELKTFRRYLQRGSELWMYGLTNGMRRVGVKDGKFEYTDYNAENGRLPNNHIPRVVEDGSHNIWVLTNGGLAVVDKGGKSTIIDKERAFIDGTLIGDKVVLLSSNNRVDVYDADQQLVMSFEGSRDLGWISKISSSFVWQGKWYVFCSKTFCIDIEKKEVTIPEKYQVPRGLLLDHIDGFFFESTRGNDLWIFPPEGDVKKINLIRNEKSTAERYRKYKICRGRDSLFYIASYGNGLFIYDHKTGETRQFTASDPKAVIDTDFLLYAYSDCKGNIWVSQDAGGAVCITPSEQRLLHTLQPAPEEKSGDWSNYIRMVAKGEGKDVVFGTRKGEVYNFNPYTEQFTLMHEVPTFATTFHIDTNGRKWIGTYGNGVFYADPPAPGAKERWQSLSELTTERIMDIETDPMGRIWIATFEEGLHIGTIGDDGIYSFENVLRGDINASRMSQLELDNKGRMWIASNNGLYIVSSGRNEIKQDSLKCFNIYQKNFPFNEIKCIAFSKDGTVWIGGNGMGLVRCRFAEDMSTVDYTIIGNGSGLSNNNVQTLAIDHYGNVWAGTQDGLSRIDAGDLSVDSYKFGAKRGQDIYSENSSQLLWDGRAVFGTQQGLVIVAPHEIEEDSIQRETPVYISDIQVNGTSTSESGLLGISPLYAEKIKLRSTENSLSISFTCLDYSGAGQSVYQYYLEGYDNDWRSRTNINHVEYGSLPPGTYKFHLKAQKDNIWSDVKTLTIIVSQPWWNTWIAWAIYVLLVAATCYYVWRNGRERMKLRQQMLFNQQLTEFKLSFFTNVTHEFRTPLAIIKGAADKLIDNCGSQSRPAVQTIRRGTNRLFRLANQLMEFRKVGTGNARLHLEQGDIVSFIRDIQQDFWSQAQQKEMQINFMPSVKSHKMPFDQQMVETIIYNLLSNAIKYTPQKGSVNMGLRIDEGNVIITIQDTGPGLEEAQLRSMDQPFMLGYVAQGGMGIGLYTANQMAKIHKGALAYQRASEEGGSLFTLKLPAYDSPYSEEDYMKVAAENRRRAGGETEQKSLEIIKELRPEAYNDVDIAIIEDEPDMMEQISSELSVYFKPDCYMTGEQALEGIAAKRPALIVCDVMLPDMSGYDIVKNLKSNPETMAIPIIMLTAMDDEAHQLKSYKAGADDYMVKPCNFRILVGRAAQLISKSKEQRVATKAPAPEPAIVTSQADNNFVKKMQMITMQHIADPEFSMDQLASLMNMGRTKFFAKAKELTGVSPNKYLQNERMRIAAGLLLEGELTVAEISFKVGIQDPSYFNKCFKAKFGVTPSKYGKPTTPRKQEEQAEETPQEEQ